jgi:hypothetical protein
MLLFADSTLEVLMPVQPPGDGRPPRAQATGHSGARCILFVTIVHQSGRIPNTHSARVIDWQTRAIRQVACGQETLILFAKRMPLVKVAWLS